MLRFQNGRFTSIIKPQQTQIYSSPLEYLKIFQYDKKIRLGAINDGGYVIADNLGNYDCYISAGVSNEESFSRDFIPKFQMNKFNSFAFDGTIIDYPWNYTRDITFIKKNIGSFEDSINTNLQNLISKYNNIFLKMDIEGGEYSWLSSLSLDNLRKFKQIVIEFHGVFDDSWNSLNLVKTQCLKKLSETHYPVHIHGNNYDTLVNYYPNVLELTYVRKDIFNSEPSLNKTSLPILGLDFPNNPMLRDFNLNFYPFKS